MKEIRYSGQSEIILTTEKTRIWHYNWYYVIITNLSDKVLHISNYSDIESRIDTVDVLSLEPGRAGYIAVAHGVLDGFFAIGNGAMSIIPSNDPKACISIVNALNATNPDLLINPDFRINQRGASGTITTAGYFVDRWKLVSGEVTINSDGTLTLNGTISQTLEKSVGTNVIASASAGTASYDDSTGTFTLTACGEVVSWAKLEKGSRSTEFIPPDPTVEYLKCRRYYQRLSGNMSSIGTGFISRNSSKYFASIVCPDPVSMRSKPTVSLSGTVYVIAHGHLSSNGYQAVEFGSTPVKSQDTLAMALTIEADDTVLGASVTAQLRDSTSYIELDAEL